MEYISLSTKSREEFVDITRQVAQVVSKNNWQNGMVILFCMHTTGGITINENADPSVQRDILQSLKGLIPRDAGYRHAEGNSDSHIKSSLMGPEQIVLVNDGRLVLGTWQGIFFTEFDGPRSRKVAVQFLAGS